MFDWISYFVEINLLSKENDQFENLETDLLQTNNPKQILNQNSEIIRSIITILNAEDNQIKLNGLRLVYTIVSLEQIECIQIIQSCFPFLPFHILSEDNQIVCVSCKIINTICHTFNQFKNNFLNQQTLEYCFNKLNCNTLDITTLTSLIQLISTLSMENENAINQLLSSSLPSQLMVSLQSTNNSKFISASLLLLSLVSKYPQFSILCFQNVSFLTYLSKLLTSSIDTSIISPSLTIIGNFFSISTTSQLTPFITPEVIDSLIKIVQRDTVLIGDAVWVLGNLVYVTPFQVVKQVVECGTLPLLFSLFENSNDTQLAYSIFITISNIMASENDQGENPYITCCLELGLLDYLTDYIKIHMTDQMIFITCDILSFLLDHDDHLFQRLQRLNTIQLLNDLKNQYSPIDSLLKKISWKFQINI